MIRLVVSLVALGFIFSVSDAQASEPRRLESSGDWSAYVFTENGSKVCYMAASPAKAEGEYSKRGEPFALITHRPSESTQDVFSYITGYPYKPGSEVTLKVDSRKFTLFTQDDTAWAPDAETDMKLAKAIRKGSRMVVQGTSTRGTLTTDTYSLKGSGKILDVINRECGL